ncbi:MAG: hypothetical protein MJZ46_02640 [Bacteroidales bacterium]|nr:hypothetical protein [Bacteroidales bacterium]
MKRNVIFIFFSLCFSFFNVKAQETSYSKEATALWRKIVYEFMANRDKNAVIHIRHINSDTINDANYMIVRNNEFEAYLNSEWGRYYKFTKDSVYMVNIWDNELMVGAVNGDFYQIFHDQEITGGIQYFESFLYPYSKHYFYTFSSIRDTLINNVKYQIIQRDFKNHFWYNQTTKKYDIPNFHIVDYYFNTSTGLIDHICANPTPESICSWKVDYYIDYSFVDSVDLIKEIFDFNNPQYANCSRHNDERPPYSWSFDEETNSSSLTRRVLDFPIVSLAGDTTAITKENGWLLLDFWWFSCRSCIEWIAASSKEKAEHGQRILESNGIKIMSINAISDNSEKLSETAEKYNAYDIIYHAKGMGKLINIYYMPQYYLISPNKKIVLKTNNLGDYSEVLKAKQKWESKHKRK